MIKKGVIVRWLILTAAIMVASYLLQGIQVSGFFSALFGAVILSLLNIFFKPVLIILTLPFNILTLGLFTFVINAFLLMMVSGVIPGFEVRDFWAALWGALLISIVNSILSSFISDKGKVGRVSSTIEMKKTGDDRWE
jgi:putative membrane protein